MPHPNFKYKNRIARMVSLPSRSCVIPAQAGIQCLFKLDTRPTIGRPALSKSKGGYDETEARHERNAARTTAGWARRGVVVLRGVAWVIVCSVRFRSLKFNSSLARFAFYHLPVCAGAHPFN